MTIDDVLAWLAETEVGSWQETMVLDMLGEVLPWDWDTVGDVWLPAKTEVIQRA